MSREVSMEVLFSCPANMLESNFGERLQWSEMCPVLGTIEKKLSIDDQIHGLKMEENESIARQSCSRATWPYSKFIIEGAQIDHAALDNRP